MIPHLNANAQMMLKGLVDSIRDGHVQFYTYGEFALKFGLSSSFALSWANKSNLDQVSAACKADPKIGLDLTFLIRSARQQYPSFIDGMSAARPTPDQRVRAREVAQAIIEKFGAGTPNPY